ncbi:hypothetical protein Tco_0564323 [Tanacetum coccineum]
MSLDFPLLSHLKKVYGGGGKWVVKAVEVEVVVVMVKVDLRDFQEEGHPICSQAKGSKVEERLVHERMKVKFKVLIEKKKMYYLGLRRFDLWMEFLMVHLEELEMKKWW